MTSRRPTVLLVAVSALLAGCGPESELSFDMRAVSVTVPKLVTPAITIVPPGPPLPAPLPPLAPTDFVIPTVPVPSASPAPLPPREACPKAPTFAVPDLSASLQVLGPPAPATYLQTTSGSFATPDGQGSLGGSVRQVVTALPRRTSSAGQVVDSWSIARSDASGSSTSVEVYRLVHESSAAGATAAGVYLVGLAWKDPVRGELAFQPSGNGLFLLPSPVTLSPSGGTQYTGTATDPNTLTTMAVVRNVTGKKRIDACGEVLETYTIEMSGVLTTPQDQWQLAWTKQLATSYGGLDVQDALTLSDLAATFRWSQGRTATSLPKPQVSP